MKFPMTRLRSARRALWHPLARARVRSDFKRWAKRPPSDEDTSLAAVNYWLPAEDWSAWNLEDEHINSETTQRNEQPSPTPVEGA